MSTGELVSGEKTQPVNYVASIYSGPGRILPPEFAADVVALEKILEMPLWLLVQSGGDKFDSLEDNLVESLLAARAELPEGGPVGLLIDSPGGSAKCSYQIATILRARCGGFTAIVPRYAKSAATLLTLGADAILLGQHAELGPLDAQYLDPEREEWVSALDEVQALERLHAFALESVDRTMFLMAPRTRKKIETLLPMILKFVSDMTRPLFEKIEAVHYTQMSRTLKVAEEYAIRLLQTKYPLKKAQDIARRLVSHYPEHGFIIDTAEAGAFELELASVSDKLQVIFDSMRPFLARLTVIGHLKEVQGNGK